MKPLNIRKVNGYVNRNITDFHNDRLGTLQKLKLHHILLKKNPYLYKAKNILQASDLVQNFMDAHLSSSEEKHFGDFLERLAVFIAGITCGGRKSSATGIDLEFDDEDKHYLVSIKSGPNWGNSSQYKKQKIDFENATRVLKQSNRRDNIQTVLGICYGKVKTSYKSGYMKVVGQNFWYLISEDENLYTEIIEPLGFEARRHNEAFHKKKTQIINLFTHEFYEEFCSDGEIDWEKLVRFNSGNLDLK